jgi:hypothetical protein
MRIVMSPAFRARRAERGPTLPALRSVPHAIVAGGVLVALAWSLLWALDLVSRTNLLLSAVAIAGSLAAYVVAARLEAPGGMGLLRLYVIMHVLFVQVGTVMIYSAFARPHAINGLYLEFVTRPSLRAVLVPLAGVAAVVAGAWFAQVLLPRRDPTGSGAGPAAALPTRATLPVIQRPLMIEDPVRHQNRSLALLLLGFVYAVVAFRSRGGFPLFSVLGGMDAEAARLSYHYGSSPVYFSSSIVSQVYFAMGPMIILGLLVGRTASRLRPVAIVWAAGLVLFLLANSLERTTIVILTVWFFVAWKYQKGRYPVLVLGLGALLFVGMTMTLHAGGLADLWRTIYLQVVRRVSVVNAMVNYFVFDRFGAEEHFRHGSTYPSYIAGIAGGDGSFAKELMTIIYPDRSIGTAPVGAIGEAWVNFGWALLPFMFLQGMAMRVVDRWLVRLRSRSAMGASAAAGVAVIGATISYGGILAILVSGGLLTVVVTYYLVTAPLVRRRRLERDTPPAKVPARPVPEVTGPTPPPLPGDAAPTPVG